MRNRRRNEAELTFTCEAKPPPQTAKWSNKTSFISSKSVKARCALLRPVSRSSKKSQ